MFHPLLARVYVCPTAVLVYHHRQGKDNTRSLVAFGPVRNLPDVAYLNGYQVWVTPEPLQSELPIRASFKPAESFITSNLEFKLRGLGSHYFDRARLRQLLTSRESELSNGST